MTKITKIFFLFACLYCGKLSAQTVPQSLNDALNLTLDSMFNQMGIKSLNAAIQFPDGSTWASASGISSVSPMVNANPNHLYLIGSITKTITSACILQLVEEQVLSLDDSLYQWLDTMPYINPNITIRQLLRHQTGIYDVLSNPNCQPALIADMDSIWAYQDLITTFINPPIAQPGGVWSYSNTNYFLLGMIIEAATANPYYEEFRNRFFMPLNLTSIAIPAYESLSGSAAHVWLDITGDGFTDDAHNFYMNYFSLNAVAGSAGGYFGTAADLSKWMRTYMRGDLLDSLTMATAQTTVAGQGLPSGTTYGLGLMKKNFNGYLAYGHGGDLAYSASSWYFPAKDIGITVLGNDADFNSWTLGPVVAALLKTYTDWELTASNENFLASESSLYVYPNPFENQLSIKLNIVSKTKELQAVLTNAVGADLAKVTKAYPEISENVLTFEHLEKLPQGVYFIRVLVDGNCVKMIKVLK